MTWENYFATFGIALATSFCVGSCNDRSEEMTRRIGRIDGEIHYLKEDLRNTHKVLRSRFDGVRYVDNYGAARRGKSAAEQQASQNEKTK